MFTPCDLGDPVISCQTLAAARQDDGTGSVYWERGSAYLRSHVRQHADDRDVTPP